MRNATLALFVGLATVLAGCSSGPEVKGRGPQAIGSASTPTKTRWSTYLQVMTDKERLEFLDIQDSFDREQWIRRNGIDVRADLHNRLARGISVEAARRRIAEVPDEITRDGSTTMLFYSRYNTQSRTNFYLMFEADQLVSWNSYTLEEQQRERHLLEFEAKLMRKFNTVLEVGMGAPAIRKQAENAQADLNRVELAHREKLGSGDFKGAGKATFSDYIVAESLLYARNRAELFSWFQGRQPDKVILHRPFETHQYYMLHKDVRGRETVVIAEFVYESGALQAWYVYHEK
ncbi:MAG: hypothetical protein HS108_15505 [Planctomycetes bacterium]|nr:hypothetical protein [Planctomycetota bacterium]MCL4728992.1 hypothetical protein [Planctomycetota bacterium]